MKWTKSLDLLLQCLPVPMHNFSRWPKNLEKYHYWLNKQTRHARHPSGWAQMNAWKLNSNKKFPSFKIKDLLNMQQRRFIHNRPDIRRAFLKENLEHEPSAQSSSAKPKAPFIPSRFQVHFIRSPLAINPKKNVIPVNVTSHAYLTSHFRRCQVFLIRNGLRKQTIA